MRKYSVRPANMSDIEQVYSLIATQYIHDYGDTLIMLEDLRESWQTLHFERDTCTAYAEGVLEGYAEMHDGDSPMIYLAERNNIDLGFQLLTIMEDIAIERKIHTLYSRVSTKNPNLSELFLLNGYHTIFTFLIMEAVMNESPSPEEWPEQITVRCFVPGQDEQANFNVDEEAVQENGDHEPIDYEAWSIHMGVAWDRLDPSLWFLACAGTEIAGVARSSYDRRTATGWVDHLNVRHAYRKRGIGKALLQHTLAEFYRRGVFHIKLSVDSKSLTNAQHFYESVGMQTVQEYSIYNKELPM
jgi:GNAT superfamily N-acetyltransferase